MMLGNYSILNRNSNTFSGNAFTNPMAQFKPEAFNRIYLSDTADHSGLKQSGFPTGYGIEERSGTAWWMPPKAGGMAAVNTLLGSGTLSASMSKGINIAGGLSGIGSLSAPLTMVVGMVGGLSGSGAITAALVGSTALVGALTGTGSLSAALGALSGMVGALSGAGTITADLRGRSWMTADITPVTELSPENLATAVWAAVAAANNDTGSMGEKLNDAGSGSNPWTEVIEGSYTAAELLRLMAAALAGELSGAATTTITIKGVDGTTDRIVATVTTDGDRTALALDGA